EVNRVQKTLEAANLKLGDVVSDIMGKASRMILHAIADGDSDPARLASLAVGRVRASQAGMEGALAGTGNEHHRFLLHQHITQIEHLEAAVDRITAEITRRFLPPDPGSDELGDEAQESCEPDIGASQERASLPEPPSGLSWEAAVVLLMSIPGISERAARALL